MSDLRRAPHSYTKIEAPAFTQRRPRINIKLFKKYYDFRAGSSKCCVTLVTPESGMQEKKVVEKIAYFFKREFGYDFAQFNAREGIDKTDYRAYYFSYDEWSQIYASRQIVMGACCFRFREYRDAPAAWALQWIWIHPFWRSSGILTSVWPSFRKIFGDFVVEPPISKSMKAFLEKRKSEELPQDKLLGTLK
jgi:hypothetical protein